VWRRVCSESPDVLVAELGALSHGP
jgi:hypothetical protein